MVQRWEGDLRVHFGPVENARRLLTNGIHRALSAAKCKNRINHGANLKRMLNKVVVRFELSEKEVTWGINKCVSSSESALNCLPRRYTRCNWPLIRSPINRSTVDIFLLGALQVLALKFMIARCSATSPIGRMCLWEIIFVSDVQWQSYPLCEQIFHLKTNK